MRRLLLSIILVAATFTSVAAQSDLTSYIFVDGEGMEVADGTVLKLTDVTEDLFGSVISSGLSVKNVAGSDNTDIRIHYTITKISGGSFQICFPTNCVSKSKTGTFYTTEGKMAQGEVRDLMTEFVLDGEGECLATVQIEQVTVTGSGLTKTVSVAAKGPTVTLAFNCDAGSDTPESEQLWWGYYDGGSRSGLGVQTADTYFAASHFTADNIITNGATIHSIRIFFQSITNISGVSVWISKSLPNTLADADYSQSVTNRSLSTLFKDGVVDVKLNTPYKIMGDVYVGYTFTVKSATSEADQYPLMTADYCDDNEGLYLKTTNAVPEWMGPVGEDYGALALQMQLSNETLSQESLELSSVGETIALLGSEEPAYIDVSVKYYGMNGVESFSYVATVDGEEQPEQTWDAGGIVPIIGKEWPTLVNVMPAKKSGLSDVKIRITKLNGKSNLSEKSEATGSLITIAKSSDRKVAVEEFTGTWCGYCPRGMVAMNRFEETYGDKFVGIAAHWSSQSRQDPMQCNDYQSIIAMVDGFPSMFINRSIDTDPYYGTTGQSITDFQPSLLDVANQLATPTEAAVKIFPTWNADSTVVSARVETTFQYDRPDAPYALAFVLTEDGMTGTAATWGQINYFYQYKQYASQFTDEPLLAFINGAATVTGLTYNHVAIAAWDIKNGRHNSVKAPLVVDETQTYNFSESITKYTKIQDKRQLKLAVLLINTETGKIVNADKAEIVEQTTGIRQVEQTGTQHTDTYYTLDGRRLTAKPTQRGIYIINGRKVIVK